MRKEIVPMKIESSVVNMQSDRKYVSVEQQIREEKLEYVTTDKASLSDTVKAMIQEQSNIAQTAKASVSLEDEWSMKIKLLEKMLAVLSKASAGNFNSLLELLDGSTEIGFENTTAVPAVGKWVKSVKTSAFFAEQEHTTFSTVGAAKTEDGRIINFNIDLQMSREFAAQVSTQWQEDIVFTDPLVINLKGNNAELTDQKFLFDIDGDGTKESISKLQSGSGYLAYDKNGNGIIDDGNELFGAKTGNGFAELSAYDADGNGWIDENDPIFEKLKIWTQDACGNTKLIGLADADVGAIYLGNVSTDFTLESEGNVHGKIRNTGFYLKESGGSGTVQHVDVAV